MDVVHIALLGGVDFVEDAVDEGGDAVDERDLGPLLEVATLTALHAQQLGSQFLAFLFEEVVIRVLLTVFPVHVAEEPEREEQQQNGCNDGGNHQVELYGRLLILTGTCFELTILTGGLLQVEIEVAVIVALGLIVHRGIGHRELLADRGHQVGRLIDGTVGECLLEIIEG